MFSKVVSGMCRVMTFQSQDFFALCSLSGATQDPGGDINLRKLRCARLKQTSNPFYQSAIVNQSPSELLSQ